MNDKTLLADKLDEYRKTKSVALAAEICDALIDDFEQAAADAMGDPTIEGEE